MLRVSAANNDYIHNTLIFSITIRGIYLDRDGLERQDVGIIINRHSECINKTWLPVEPG